MTQIYRIILNTNIYSQNNSASKHYLTIRTVYTLLYRTMDLKDFVKGVILDITNAVKECQDEVSNGAIISPTNSKAAEKVRASNGDLKISYIDFEVAVTAGTATGVNGEVKGGIKVLSSFIGSKIGGDSKETNENTSKVKFSIPVIYPTFGVKERPILS